VQRLMLAVPISWLLLMVWPLLCGCRFSVETAVLILDETKRPSEYVPFVLRKSPRLAHLTLHTRR